MNCIIWILLLLSCGNGNGCNGNCHNENGCKGCGRERCSRCKDYTEEDRTRRYDGDRDHCDIPGFIPPPWKDGAMDARDPRMEYRGETCGCEEKKA